MSESLREQRPLLCEDLSDEELRPSHYCPQRTFKRSLSGRARNKVKGAAAIITRWPDYWSSSVLFWWIVVGMSLLLVMVIYNTIVALVLIPSALSLPFSTEQSVETQNKKLDVNMHVFIEKDEIVDLKHYLPFVNKLTDKDENFNYNFIVLFNDSTTTVSNNIIEDNNENAMNDILSDSVINRRDVSEDGALNVRHFLLSEYLNDSPLRNRWQNIPAQFLPFLVRAVSIWENGGIAIDPLILTPHTPNSIYSEKLLEIMNEFGHAGKNDKKTAINKEEVKQDHHIIPMKRVNSIQDIIDNADFDNSLLKLSEAEDHEVDETIAEKISLQVKKRSIQDNIAQTKLHNNDTINKKDENKITKVNHISEKERRSPVVRTLMSTYSKNQEGNEGYRPMIVLPDDDGKTLVHKGTNYSLKNNEKLVIDLKGIFLATRTSCHAFIGTIFNDAVHQSSIGNVSDFIIQELSKFCNGVLTSCKGIDVILV